MTEKYYRLISTIKVPKDVKDFGGDQWCAAGEGRWLPDHYGGHLVDEKLALEAEAPMLLDELETDAGKVPDYESMTKDQLVALAIEQGVQIGSGDNKADIIVKLKA